MSFAYSAVHGLMLNANFLSIHFFHFWNWLLSHPDLCSGSEKWKQGNFWPCSGFPLCSSTHMHFLHSSQFLFQRGGVEKSVKALTEAAFLLSGNKEIACFLLNNGAGFSSYTLMDHADFSRQLLRQRHLQDKDEPVDGTLLQVRLIPLNSFQISAAASFYRSFSVSPSSSF